MTVKHIKYNERLARLGVKKAFLQIVTPNQSPKGPSGGSWAKRLKD